MPSIHRISDINTYDNKALEGSSNVMAGNLNVVREGDIYYNDIVIEGSPNVFVNNLNVAREGDTNLSPKGNVINGMDTVIVN